MHGLRGVNFANGIFMHAKACNFFKKDTLTHVFPCQFATFLRTPFFTEHPWAIASVNTKA